MILVSGATGTTGREVVRQLVEAQVPVRAFVRDPAAATTLLGTQVECAQGDFEEPESLRSALRNVDKLFLLSPADPRQVEQQGHAVEVAQECGVQYIVKLSALGADTDSAISLARWHAQTEHQIEESGIAFTHLRPHWFMQNMLSFAATIVAEGRFYAPMKDARISMVDCRDIAAVAVRVLTEAQHAGRTYDITGAEALSFHDVAAAITAATDRPVEYVDVSPADAERAMLAAGMPGWLAEALNGLYTIFSAGHASTATRIVEDLVGRGAIPFRQFAVDYGEAFKPS